MRGPLRATLQNMTTVLYETVSQEMIPFYDEFTYEYDREDPCGKKEYYFVEAKTGKNITFLEVVDDLILLKPSLSEEIG